MIRKKSLFLGHHQAISPHGVQVIQVLRHILKDQAESVVVLRGSALSRCGIADASADLTEPTIEKKDISPKERKLLVEKFVNEYRETNSGKFPSVDVTMKNCGGSHYFLRQTIHKLLESNYRHPKVSNAKDVVGMCSADTVLETEKGAIIATEVGRDASNPIETIPSKEGNYVVDEGAPFVTKIWEDISSTTGTNHTKTWNYDVGRTPDEPSEMNSIISPDEWRFLVENFMHQYRETNSGINPSIRTIMKYCGGSYKFLARIIHELESNNGHLKATNTNNATQVTKDISSSDTVLATKQGAPLVTLIGKDMSSTVETDHSKMWNYGGKEAIPDEPSGAHKEENISPEERRSLVEKYVHEYAETNSGKFPPLIKVRKNCGGDNNFLRRIVRELESNYRHLKVSNPNDTTDIGGIDDAKEGAPVLTQLGKDTSAAVEASPSEECNYSVGEITPDEPSGTHKMNVSISPTGRRLLVEKFVHEYAETNSGNFPSLKKIIKNCGGDYYVLRRIVRELESNYRHLEVSNPNDMTDIGGTHTFFETKEGSLVAIQVGEDIIATIDEARSSKECNYEVPIATEVDKDTSVTVGTSLPKKLNCGVHEGAPNVSQFGKDMSSTDERNPSRTWKCGVGVTTPAESSQPHEKRRRLPWRERFLVVEKFVHEYTKTNSGRFPSQAAVVRKCGGNQYIVRDIIQELEYNYKHGVVSNLKEVMESSRPDTALETEEGASAVAKIGKEAKRATKTSVSKERSRGFAETSVDEELALSGRLLQPNISAVVDDGVYANVNQDRSNVAHGNTDGSEGQPSKYETSLFEDSPVPPLIDEKFTPLERKGLKKRRILQSDHVEDSGIGTSKSEHSPKSGEDKLPESKSVWQSLKAFADNAFQFWRR